MARAARRFMYADATADPIDTSRVRVRLARALEEVRDALSREAPDDAESGPGARVVRRHRALIVLCTLVGALWLGFAGMVSAATRPLPLAESVLAFVPDEPAAARIVGPIEWPTIAIAHRPDPFPKKAHKTQQAARKKGR